MAPISRHSTIAAVAALATFASLISSSLQGNIVTTTTTTTVTATATVTGSLYPTSQGPYGPPPIYYPPPQQPPRTNNIYTREDYYGAYGQNYPLGGGSTTFINNPGYGAAGADQFIIYDISGNGALSGSGGRRGRKYNGGGDYYSEYSSSGADPDKSGRTSRRRRRRASGTSKAPPTRSSSSKTTTDVTYEFVDVADPSTLRIPSKIVSQDYQYDSYGGNGSPPVRTANVPATVFQKSGSGDVPVKSMAMNSVNNAAGNPMGGSAATAANQQRDLMSQSDNLVSQQNEFNANYDQQQQQQGNGNGGGSMAVNENDFFNYQAQAQSQNQAGNMANGLDSFGRDMNQQINQFANNLPYDQQMQQQQLGMGVGASFLSKKPSKSSPAAKKAPVLAPPTRSSNQRRA